jgi:HPr kinase/phosphorylase
MAKFTVLDLLQLDLKENDALDLKCAAGRPGLVRAITIAEINRPGLELSGFYDNFAYRRIQLFGMGETAYLEKLEREGRRDTIQELMRYEVPCCIFTHSLVPTAAFREEAEAKSCPILTTDLTSGMLTTRIIRVLEDVFAPKASIHGVLVEVFGIGILIVGESGVGKSETALALVERGHRLVADDLVEISRVSGNILSGKGSGIVSHHMEIRGLGIINVAHLFGVGAIRDRKQVQLVVELEEWDAKKNYDRVGGEEATMDILEVKVPKVVVPVKPGRNISIIIETAAMNERLKKMGYYSARDFDRNVTKWLETENARAVFETDR